VNRTVALRLLGEIMNWDDERATVEYRWLHLMARLKYDAYSDFMPGARFLEKLVAWLRGLKPAHRPAAYDLVRRHLIYIGSAELDRLIDGFYPDSIRPWLAEEVARRLDIDVWRVGVDAGSKAALEDLRRRTLLVGLSEGAHCDRLRRANPGVLSNEQIIVSHQVSEEKWMDLVKNLRKDTEDDRALFVRAVLIDDFTASGTSLIRRDNDGSWGGKLYKFLSAVRKAEASAAPVFESTWTAGVHHYIATTRALENAPVVEAQARQELRATWYNRVDFTYGYEIPASVMLPNEAGPLKDLIDTYYDPAIETEHNLVGGGSSDMRWGYKDCRLPLVLEHNTPNNSVPILWTDSPPGSASSVMRALFRRHQRHV
jgi:hypothetical protein